MLNINRTDIGSQTVLRLEGEIDAAGVEILRSILYDCASEGRNDLVLNMQDVTYISYLGVGILVDRLRKLHALDGDLRLAGLSVYAQRLFRMAGIASLFSVFKNEIEALGAPRMSPPEAA